MQNSRRWGDGERAARETHRVKGLECGPACARGYLCIYVEYRGSPERANDYEVCVRRCSFRLRRPDYAARPSRVATPRRRQPLRCPSPALVSSFVFAVAAFQRLNTRSIPSAAEKSDDEFPARFMRVLFPWSVGGPHPLLISSFFFNRFKFLDKPK